MTTAEIVHPWERAGLGAAPFRCVGHTVERLQRTAQRGRRHEREVARDERTREQLRDETIRAELAAKPHPNKWRAEQGATLLDWCEWTMKHAGATGRGKVAKMLRAGASL